MPYAPGIDWRVGENLAAGIAQFGQNIQRYTERRRSEAQESAALRKLLSIYAPEQKDSFATMGLGDLRGAAQGIAVQQAQQRQRTQDQLAQAQIANLQADNERAAATAAERTDMVNRLKEFSTRFANVTDQVGPTPTGQTMDDVQPLDVMRMAAQSGVLGSPQVNELIGGLLRYGAGQQTGQAFQPRVVTLSADASGNPLTKPVRVVQTGPNQSAMMQDSPDGLTESQKANVVSSLRTRRSQIVLALANPVNQADDTKAMLEGELDALDEEIKALGGKVPNRPVKPSAAEPASPKTGKPDPLGLFK